MSEHSELTVNGELVPYPSGNDVYWEHWVDAYNNEGIDNTKKMIQEIEEETDAMLAGEPVAYNDDFDEEDIPFFNPQIKTMMTPFGVLPLTEDSFASKHFKFWVGHTNFKLWEHYYEVIGNVLGVESVDILTPLRFRIAVGKMFQDNEVKEKVKEALLEALKNESKKS